VDPIVRAKLIRRPSFFLAGLLRRLFSICSPKIPGDMDLFRSVDSHPRRSDQACDAHRNRNFFRPRRLTEPSVK
jgi:hypothetical protein